VPFEGECNSRLYGVGTLVSLVIKIGDVSGNGVFWLVGTLFPDFVPLKECAILHGEKRFLLCSCSSSSSSSKKVKSSDLRTHAHTHPAQPSSGKFKNGGTVASLRSETFLHSHWWWRTWEEEEAVSCCWATVSKICRSCTHA